MQFRLEILVLGNHVPVSPNDHCFPACIWAYNANYFRTERFEVLRAVVMKSPVFWDVRPRSSLN
jgi:hypothetical protein